ncbi:hypothetical protein NEIMUCOT_05424 [Neisseria mucosa ATCC 25996]|uniref:Uncharacterized protein n=1 Tax=Neisseria mucosa (strain ATCC 25996 / DSM 4631 / NCTC 10774 / M26) TaxID=546266 RepID=D2ZXS1_NEIM2|nr:hypothetical protein NEIMUCOT_05424 [Neisseria mucosa ATCC 25996]
MASFRRGRKNSVILVQKLNAINSYFYFYLVSLFEDILFFVQFKIKKLSSIPSFPHRQEYESLK